MTIPYKEPFSTPATRILLSTHDRARPATSPEAGQRLNSKTITQPKKEPVINRLFSTQALGKPGYMQTTINASRTE